MATRRGPRRSSPLQEFIARHGTIDTFTKSLDAAEPRPGESAPRDQKKNYAERFSNALAVLVANKLRAGPKGQPYFANVLPKEGGEGQESRARTGKGVKKLDVNYSTPELGLGLGVSLKTINFKDPATQRYTKNIVRVDNELRAEAMDYHVRQPYAVLVAVVLLPADAAEDGKGKVKNSCSSFAHAVNTLRHRAGRRLPTEDAQLFEAVWIGLYDFKGARRGRVGFFDALGRVPQFGRPPEGQLLDLERLVQAIVAAYDQRNKVTPAWESPETDAAPPSLAALDEQGLLPEDDSGDEESD